jgi:hypothetical protein
LSPSVSSHGSGDNIGSAPASSTVSQKPLNNRNRWIYDRWHGGSSALIGSSNTSCKGSGAGLT